MAAIGGGEDDEEEEEEDEEEEEEEEGEEEGSEVQEAERRGWRKGSRLWALLASRGGWERGREVGPTQQFLIFFLDRWWLVAAQKTPDQVPLASAVHMLGTSPPGSADPDPDDHPKQHASLHLFSSCLLPTVSVPLSREASLPAGIGPEALVVESVDQPLRGPPQLCKHS